MRVHALTLASIYSASNQFMNNGPDPYQQVPYPYFLSYQGRQVASPTPPQVNQVHVAVNPIQGGGGFPYRSATPGGNYPDPVVGFQDGNYPERMGFPGYGKAPPVETPRAEAPRSIQYVVHRHTIAHTYDKGSPVIRELDKRISTLEGMVRMETTEVESEAREIEALKKRLVSEEGGMHAEIDKLQGKVGQFFSKLQEVVTKEKQINENNRQVVDVLLRQLREVEARIIAKLRDWPAWVEQNVAEIARKNPRIEKKRVQEVIISRIGNAEKEIIRKLQQEYETLLAELKQALSGGASLLQVKEVAADVQQKEMKKIQEMALKSRKELSEIINTELHRIVRDLLHSEAKRTVENSRRTTVSAQKRTKAKEDAKPPLAPTRQLFAEDTNVRNILGVPEKSKKENGEEDDDEDDDDGEEEGDDGEDDDDDDDNDDDEDEDDEDEDDEDAEPKNRKKKPSVRNQR